METATVIRTNGPLISQPSPPPGLLTCHTEWTTHRAIWRAERAMTGALAGLLAAVSVPAANSFLSGLDEKLTIKACFKHVNLGIGSLLTGRLEASHGGDNAIGSRRNSSRAVVASFGRSSGGRYQPAKIYARDRVVDFGKNKGSMLGTLSSRFVCWPGLFAFIFSFCPFCVLVLWMWTWH